MKILQKQNVRAIPGVEPKIFKALLVLFIFLIISYIFFIGHITFSILARKSTEKNIKNISSVVNDMELKYLALDSSIDLTIAHNAGYKDANNIVFAKTDDRDHTVGYSPQ